MKTEKEYIYRKSENLSDWIKEYEDYAINNVDLDDEMKEYIKDSMKECSKERDDFHNNYLYNLDENLNVLSSKNNYHYLDFIKSPDPYAPIDKGLFKKVKKNKN